MNNGRVLSFDLIDILRIAEAAMVASSWTCKYVDAMGETAKELHHASDSGDHMSGAELLRLATGVYQIIDGDFEARRAGESEPWLVIRAIDSTLYVVITDDDSFLARVRERFQDVRDSPDDAEYVS